MPKATSASAPAPEPAVSSTASAFAGIAQTLSTSFDNPVSTETSGTVNSTNFSVAGGPFDATALNTNVYNGWWPNYPVVPYVETFGSNNNYLWYPTDYRFWGVQQHVEIAKGDPEFRVVNPFTLVALPRTAKIVAWTLTENDAVQIAKLLNGHEAAPLVKPEGAASYNIIQAEVKALAGRILTVLDASIANLEQNKALKSLTKREFRDSLSKLWRCCHRIVGENESSANEPDPLD